MVFIIAFLAFLLAFHFAISVYLYKVKFRNTENNRYAKLVLKRAFPIWLGTMLLTICLSFVVGIFVSLYAVSFVITGGLTIFLTSGLVVSVAEMNKIKKQSGAIFRAK